MCGRERTASGPVLRDIGQGIESALQVGVGGDGVAHPAREVALVGGHVKVTGAGQAKEDGLGLAGLLAFQGFVHGPADGVRRLRGGQDRLVLGKKDCRLEHLGLFIGHRLQIAVMVQLGEDGAHAVVAQAAGVVGRGDEPAAQGVHPGQRGDAAGVAEVVGIPPAGQGRAGGRLHRHKTGVTAALQPVGHEGGNQAAQIGAAAGAAHHHVGIFVQLFHGQLALQPDDGLVQHHLIQHAAQHIPLGPAAGEGGFHRLRDGAAQAAGGVRVFGQDLPPHLGGVGRGRRHLGVEHAHHRLAEGLLLVGALDHIHIAGQPKVGAGLRKGGAPLAGPGLGGDAGQALLLGVIGLGHGGIQLVGAGSVVALKFVVDPGRGAQGLFQLIGADQRRGAVHLVDLLDGLGDVHIGRRAVQLLAGQFLAENGGQVVHCEGLEGGRVQQRVRLLRHGRPQVEPLLGHLIFGEVQAVGDLGHAHFLALLYNLLAGEGIEKSPRPKFLWDKGL